jgi:hypothetical protein
MLIKFALWALPVGSLLAYFADSNVFTFQVSLGNLATIAALLGGLWELDKLFSDFRIEMKTYIWQHNWMWVEFCGEEGLSSAGGSSAPVCADH